MPVITSEGLPDVLKPYKFHGLNISPVNGKEVVADCPWCGKHKFSIDQKTGLWRCFSCAEGNEKGGGNALVFLCKLWDESDKATNDYEDLLESRRLLNFDTLAAWGLCQSITTDDWIVPGYSADGKLRQLYRYMKGPDRYRLLPTPTLGHCLHGVNLFDPKKPIVYLCEGPWDALALWEVLGQTKSTEDERFVQTSNVSSSLLAKANVLAVPGCTVFFEEWLPLFAGKEVRLMYDNDYPRINPKSGKQIAPAGLTGMQRTARILAASNNPPSVVKYLAWGGDATHDGGLPDGADVRDWLAGHTPGVGLPLEARISALPGLLGRLRLVPAAWVPQAASGPARGLKTNTTNSGNSLPLLECTSFKVLVNAWRKAMRWTDGLEHALTVMLASIASTRSVGDQLWIKVIGPASCGKSTLCEAVSVNTQYVLAKSTIRGFHSGFRTEGGEQGEDNSLVSMLYNKTLVTKDGDTLLQSPNLGQILSEARDLYDSTARTHYRNATSKDYQGVRMTWLLCGTSSLRAIDSSELGERFLDCVIMEGIDEDMEDEVLWRVANRADRNLSIAADSDISSHYEPDLAYAMQLTGGYVSYLRENTQDEMSSINNPDWAMRKCTRLGKFVAFMRARPSQRQEETAEREFAARLVSQLIRLAKCLAFVLNRNSVDVEVMQRVKRVALDTSRGQTLAIAVQLYEAKEEGLLPSTIAMNATRAEDKTKALLRFLKLIGLVETFTPEVAKGVRGKTKWRLTTRATRLFKDVYSE